MISENIVNDAVKWILHIDGMGVGAYHGWRLGTGAGPAARGDNPLTTLDRTLLILISCYPQEGRAIESRKLAAIAGSNAISSSSIWVWGQKLNGQSSDPTLGLETGGKKMKSKARAYRNLFPYWANIWFPIQLNWMHLLYASFLFAIWLEELSWFSAFTATPFNRQRYKMLIASINIIVFPFIVKIILYFKLNLCS